MLRSSLAYLFIYLITKVAAEDVTSVGDRPSFMEKDNAKPVPQMHTFKDSSTMYVLEVTLIL